MRYSSRPPSSAATLLATLLLVCACGGGCADGGPPAADPAADGAGAEAARPIAFAPELGIHPDSMTVIAEGILIRDVKSGTGPTAGPGQATRIEYRAWLPDGTLYEQRPDAQGFGAAELMPGASSPAGLAAGVEGMRVGGVRRIVLSPDQGYGLVGRPAGVPAGSTLVFEVRLVAVSE